MNYNEVILVNEEDEEIGTMDKLQAHQEGVLHRAFSIFIFNSQGELLLQQRALGKYHSGGLWTNTCCSHPSPGESLEQATQRRLPEEMGFSCNLNHTFHFIYKANLDKQLVEHELDHVFIGTSDITPQPNPSEVCAYKYVSKDDIRQELSKFPENYTEWFKICFQRAFDSFEALKK